MRTGIANLPLHSGRAPRWLFERMTKLAREMVRIIVEDFGPDEVLQRLSDPYWFQAFGCVLGFDWHSSGVTTTVCGAVKEGVAGLEKNLGLFVAGGKGGRSRLTPAEIESKGEIVGVDVGRLVYASKMSAKVDNTAVQDGYQLYHHNFLFTAQGNWCVIQQGMNDANGFARRYHWLGSQVEDFVKEPHAAICCDQKTLTLNLVASESEATRLADTTLSREHPEKILAELKKITTLELPRRHQIIVADIHPDRLKKTFIATYERQPENFETLLGIGGVGPKTIRSLSLIAELLYGTKPSWEDPARFAFAHGGKDGIPFPVDRKTYDRSTEYLRGVLNKSHVERTEKLKALQRLGQLVRY